MKSLKKINNPFVDILPSIDLHGVDRYYAVMKTKEFIDESIILNNKKIVIIHGLGKGIIKKEIHEYLKNDKRVKNYYLDNYNNGITIIEI